jgi:hypothetical protein
MKMLAIVKEKERMEATTEEVGINVMHREDLGECQWVGSQLSFMYLFIY